MSSNSSNNSSNFDIRPVAPEQWAAIADLHLKSWRSAYRGILTGEYLDGEIELERSRAWQARIGSGIPPDIGLFAARQHGQLVGFVCANLNPDRTPQWGPRVENLHCHPDYKGKGTGRALLVRAAQWVEEERPGSALHLYVYDLNEAARGFYRRMGATEVESIMVSAADGRDHPEKVCWWPSARLVGSGSHIY